MEGFLYCLPSVFAIENRYEILVFAKENGIIKIRTGNSVFYEENNGTLSSEKRFAKISVPQSVLNENKSYTVLYRKTIDRKIYYPTFEEEESLTFAFRPLEKTENINVYHIADIHRAFCSALKTADFFGDDTDLYIINGDIGEVRNEQDYCDVANLTGEISKGEIPVIFSRGNHDARGKCADRFTEFFPADGKNTYYTFDLGVLSGIVLDCGEDKLDNHREYNGVNVFERFRERETEFISGAKLNSDKINFAVCHICPVFPTETQGDCFDIERETYKVWNDNLKRMGIRFMLTGHIHKEFVIEKHSAKCFCDNDYTIIVGSAVDYDTEYVAGAALTVSKTDLRVRFTDTEHKVLFDKTYDIRSD